MVLVPAARLQRPRPCPARSRMPGQAQPHSLWLPLSRCYFKRALCPRYVWCARSCCGGLMLVRQVLRKPSATPMPPPPLPLPQPPQSASGVSTGTPSVAAATAAAAIRATPASVAPLGGAPPSSVRRSGHSGAQAIVSPLPQHSPASYTPLPQDRAAERAAERAAMPPPPQPAFGTSPVMAASASTAPAPAPTPAPAPALAPEPGSMELSVADAGATLSREIMPPTAAAAAAAVPLPGSASGERTAPLLAQQALARSPTIGEARPGATVPASAAPARTGKRRTPRSSNTPRSSVTPSASITLRDWWYKDVVDGPSGGGLALLVEVRGRPYRLCATRC